MNEQRVRTAIADAIGKVVKLPPEHASRLHDPDFDMRVADLAIDSLDTLELCMEIETSIGIELDPAELVALDTLEELIGLVAGKDRPVAASLQRASRDRPLPLSLVQESVWTYCQNLADSSGYILNAIDRIEGPLDIAILADSLGAVVSRHEILRTTFPLLDGRPVQMVHPAETVAPSFVVIAANEDPAQAARRILETGRATICDLANGPLRRFVVLRISEQEHLLIRFFHHMVWDGWSGKLFLEELWSLYEAQCLGKPARLPEMRLQYADYAAWQQRVFDPAGEAYQHTIAWWEAYFKDIQSPPELPFKRPEIVAGVDPSAGRLARAIPPDLVKRLKGWRGAGGATLYRICLAGVVAGLFLETNCSQLIIGSYITGRRHGQLRNMIGDFSNTIALKLKCEAAVSFRELVAQVGETVAAAESHGEIPFDRLSAELKRRNIATPPLRMIFATPLSQEPRLVAGLKIDRYSALQPPPSMPWGCTLTVREQDWDYRCVVHFDAGLYDPSLVQIFMDRLHRILDAVSHDPELTVGELGTIDRGVNR